MNTVPFVSDALVRALGWALAHSLWQATAAALLLLLLTPRLQTARQRYWAAYGALVAVFAAVLITFGWSYDNRQQLVETAPETANSANGVSFWTVGQPAGVWQSFTGWLEANHALVVALWLLGFGFFLLRLGSGFWQVQRLRTRGVRLPEPEWLERFDTLRRVLGLKYGVQLLESAWIQTPMALGWLKPVVLLPIGLVNRLSVAEVEAVLAHELAHIARRDWIFNLTQAFIESLFYYHPAVWWMSAVVRRERENCCDDDALAATGNPLAFAKALVQVQEMAVPVPALALGLSGKRRRPLLNRVRRILNQPPQQQHQVMEKITATIILLALLALVGLKANSVPTIEAAFSQISDIPASIFSEFSDDQAVATDSLPKPKTTHKITREDDNQKVEAEYQDGKLTRLSIDGKEIPAAEFDQHQEIVEALEEDIAPPTFPTPPSPPTPASGFWYAPNTEAWGVPAPAAPRAPGAMPEAPMPPFPPMATSPLRVFTDKDSEGNTVITLNNTEGATEVVVKGKDVYVNGKKLEKGESLNIPGASFDGYSQFYFPGNAEGYGYSIGGAASPAEFDAKRLAELEQFNAEHGRELERAMLESKKAMEMSQRYQQEDMKRAQKELEASQKDWEKQQKAWEKQQKEWEKQQKAWEKDQQKWEKKQREWEAKNKATQEALHSELLKDGLIGNTDVFSIELNDKVFKVNKKVQSETLRKKYLELVERLSGNKLDGKGSFFYNYSED